MGTTRLGQTPENISKISIHVPAMGTTYALSYKTQKMIISIHVPAMGTTGQDHTKRLLPLFQSTCPRWARLLSLGLPPYFLLFQSTCPRWARPWRRAMDGYTGIISIHVPAMGTTAKSDQRGFDLRYFNPRARDGHDSLSPLPAFALSVFQSTCPRWARPFRNPLINPAGLFQSTCPRWARRWPSRFPRRAGRFQSTCPRWARLW